MIDAIKGPLGSHKQYITHVALANGIDYLRLKEHHREKRRSATSHKYKEFRYFLNAVESLNNIVDYLYFEYEEEIFPETADTFKTNLIDNYQLLGQIMEIANAYKHSIRTKKVKRGKPMAKNTMLRWARDLQKPELHIDISVGSPKVSVSYDFVGPHQEDESKLMKALEFWIRYLNHDPTTDDLIKKGLRSAAKK